MDIFPKNELSIAQGIKFSKLLNCNSPWNSKYGKSTSVIPQIAIPCPALQ
jgi:hypothetical protein